jgi:hypothetical protein
MSVIKNIMQTKRETVRAVREGGYEKYGEKFTLNSKKKSSRDILCFTT